MESKDEKVELETIDVENKSTSDIFQQIYGKDVMDQAQEKTNELYQNMEKEKRNVLQKTKSQKSKIGFVNKGLNVDTNARLSVFASERVYENDWTESTLNLLEAWRTACNAASEKHANAARLARRRHRQISVPSLFIGAIGTALSFFSAGEVCDPDDDGSENVKYAVAGFTSAMAIIGGISSLYSFNQKMSENISAAGNFANLARRMEVQIFLPNHLRAPAEVVLTEIGSDFANLTNTSPLL